MKFLPLLLALFFSIAACDQTKKEEQKSGNGPKTVNIKLSELATTKDLNCGMDLAEGSIADTASYDGKTYGFCSPECKVDFLKDPQGHLTKQ